METTTSKITFFNRHESMDSETRSTVLNLIREMHTVESGHRMENYLYGLFDGYNYFLTEGFEKQVLEISKENEELAIKICNFYHEVINNYPVTTEPNNNNF